MYAHTQKAPLCLFLYPIAVVMFVSAWFCQGQQQLVALILLASGLLVVVLAMAFHSLTVTDEVERLAIRFGPLPLFWKTIRYEEIEQVETGRTTILEGWGIHKSPRGGWVFNLWGRNCVVIERKMGTIRVGTDDAENLVRFLRKKTGAGK